MDSSTMGTTPDNNFGNLGGGGGLGSLANASPKWGLAGFLESSWFQWAFVLSCVATSAAFSKPNTVSLLCNVLAFAVAYYITFRKQILKHVFFPTQPTVFWIAFVYTFFAVGFSTRLFWNHFPAVPYCLQSQMGIPPSLQPVLAETSIYLLYLTTAPAFFVFLYAFIPRIVAFATEIYKTSDKIERHFFVAVMLIAIVAVTVIYNQTNCFYAPVEIATEKLVPWDVVYTFDSTVYYNNYYYHCGFLHRALLHLFFLPFAFSAYICSHILFFIPNAFPIFLCLVQTAQLTLAVLLLSRLLHLQGLSKTAFLTSYATSYAVLLNAITLDGYIVSTFWLVCFLYLLLKESKQSCDYAYIAATGNLATSGILLFFLIRIGELKKSLLHVSSVLFSFVVFLLVFNVNFFEKLLHSFGYYTKFTGITFSFYEKFLQYINFITSCFIRPETIVAPPFLENVGTWMNYQLAPVESLNLPGVFLLAFCLLGFALNFKDKFAQLCAFWIAFSFLVLCLVGWGTAENGLILYSLYFGWAYFCLAFLAIEKLLQKLPAVKYAVYVAIVAVLASYNLPGIYDLIQFGVKYYPA